MKYGQKDEYFKQKQETIKSFEFNNKVAEVFDDMVSRSVPFYDEIHRIITDILDRTYHEEGLIYDLGCSTGTTISIMDKFLMTKGKQAKFIGIDNSSSMLEKCEEKIRKNNIRNAKLICDSIENVDLQQSKMIVMNYTLQFIEKEKRPKLLKKIQESLDKNGIFIFSEKIESNNIAINDLLTELYYDFKRRNGYSELEISQKREALENVLVPLTPEEQLIHLKDAGFKKVDVLFRWYNFACFIGIK